MSIFSFLDEIAEVKKNESLTAFYSLRGDEEFLKDHFEDFPVMPGALQLEALKQAAAWLLSESQGYPVSAYRLVAAGDVRFGQFVRPGSRLKIHVRLARQNGPSADLTGRIDLLQNDALPAGRQASAGRSLSADLNLERVRF